MKNKGYPETKTTPRNNQQENSVSIDQKNEKRVFLSIRISQEELNQIKKMALKSGMGPSSFTRQLLMEKLNQEDKTAEQEAGGSQVGSETGKNPGETTATTAKRNICVFDIGSAKVNPDIMQSLIYTLNEACNCKVFTPQDMGYDEADRLIKEQMEIK